MNRESMDSSVNTDKEIRNKFKVFIWKILSILFLISAFFYQSDQISSPAMSLNFIQYFKNCMSNSYNTLMKRIFEYLLLLLLGMQYHSLPNQKVQEGP